MPTTTKKKSLAPPHIICRLPPVDLLRETLLDSVIELPPNTTLTRAAWNAASILPKQVERTYRFGPPEFMQKADRTFPFHWIYGSLASITSIWEAGLCANDATRPGFFYFTHGAGDALIAQLSFPVPLRLLDLNGLATSKLGIFDDISSPDHEWSQWFGCMLDTLIMSQKGGVHGIRYPSRKHRGHDAIALSSRSMAMLCRRAQVSYVLFKDTAEYALLQADSCCVPPP